MKSIYTLIIITLFATSCQRAQYASVSNNPGDKIEAVLEEAKTEPMAEASAENIVNNNVSVPYNIVKNKPETTTEATASTIRTTKSSIAKTTFKQRLMRKIIAKQIRRAKRDDGDDDDEYSEGRGFSVLSLLSFFAGIGSLVALVLAVSTFSLTTLIVGAGLTLFAIIAGFVGVSSAKRNDSAGKGFGITGIVFGFISLTVLLIGATLVGLFASIM